MPIIYRTDITPETQQVIDLYKSAGLNRPVDDFERIAKMYAICQSDYNGLGWQPIDRGIARAYRFLLLLLPGRSCCRKKPAAWRYR